MNGPPVAAVDVGGTTIKGAVLDAAGGVLRECSRPTPAAQGSDAVVSAVLEVVERLRAPEPAVEAGATPTASGVPAAVGVVVPGVVDAAAGCAVYSANLGFRDVPLREIVQRASGLPALLEHDVRAAGVAEQILGATAGVQDYLLAVIGTGIAAVVCTGGQRISRNKANFVNRCCVRCRTGWGDGYCANSTCSNHICT